MSSTRGSAPWGTPRLCWTSSAARVGFADRLDGGVVLPDGPHLVDEVSWRRRRRESRSRGRPVSVAGGLPRGVAAARDGLGAERPPSATAAAAGAAGGRFGRPAVCGRGCPAHVVAARLPVDCGVTLQCQRGAPSSRRLWESSAPVWAAAVDAASVRGIAAVFLGRAPEHATSNLVDSLGSEANTVH